MKNRSTLHHLTARWVRKSLLFTLLFFLTGTLFVYKENWHSNLACRLEVANSLEKALMNESGRVEIEYTQQTNYMVITKRATNELGMLPLEQPVEILMVEGIGAEADQSEGKDVYLSASLLASLNMQRKAD